MLGASICVVGADAAIIPDWILVSSETMAVRPPPQVVHMIWTTVNVRPSGTAAEAGTVTILFAGKAVRTPPTWRATVDDGYTHGSSLSADGAQATNSMVSQDTDKLFIQVRPLSWRNTYVLRLVVLICFERIMMS